MVSYVVKKFAVGIHRQNRQDIFKRELHIKPVPEPRIIRALVFDPAEFVAVAQLHVDPVPDRPMRVDFQFHAVMEFIFAAPGRIVIYLKVSRDWSFKHLMERAQQEGRSDDTPESINHRLDWFERDVMPAINYYRRDRDYDYIEIDGERSIEEVHQEIMANVFGE